MGCNNSRGSRSERYVLFCFQTDELFMESIGFLTLFLSLKPDYSFLTKDLLLQFGVLIVGFGEGEAYGFKFILEIGRGSGSGGRRRRDPVVRRLAVFEP